MGGQGDEGGAGAGRVVRVEGMGGRAGEEELEGVMRGQERTDN